MTRREPLASRLPFLLAIGLSVIGIAAPAEAQMTAGPSDDVESIINGLGPGDELILDDGMYTMTERFSFDIAGTAAEPIVIRAADGATPHFHRPDASQNLWDVTAEHVVIRGLEFSGGSAGLRVEAASHLTIEGCHVHDTADVAVRFNNSGQTYDDIQIVRNHIHDTSGTGEGMYLGCNSDGCRLSNSLVAENYVHHTNDASVSQGDGIELKEGSFNVVIRDNVIHDTNYPCILTYAAVGNGPPNTIERNVMWNCGDHGIQSAADATIRNNIILSAAATGIAMQPHQAGTPSNLVVVHNTVLNGGDTIAVRNMTGAVTIANNAVYSVGGAAIRVVSGTAMLTLAGNVGVGGVNGASGGFSDGDIGADFVMGHYDGAPPIDVFPATGGALVGAGDAAHVVTDDFNGTDRGGVADVGAYAYAAGGNPGWTIGEGFKEETPVLPGTDGGVVMPGEDGGMIDPGEDDASVPPLDGGGMMMMGAGDDGGCGCRVAGARSSGSAALLAFGLGAVVAARRRRRAQRGASRSRSSRT